MRCKILAGSFILQLRIAMERAEHWLHIFHCMLGGKKYHEGRILVGNKIDCASIDQLCNKARSLSERSLCNSYGV